ncbi:MAG: exosortase E/protease, VPEID-CTERM system [Planctomycetia bacterium]
MRSNTVPTREAAADNGRPWRAIAVLSTVVFAEFVLVAWLFRSVLLALPGKQWAACAALVVFGGLRSHVLAHREDYRDTAVSWPLVGVQVLSFGGILAAIGGLAAAAGRATLGETGSLVTLAVPLVAWLVSSLALIAPTGRLLRHLLATAAVFGAFAALAWNVGDFTRTFWSYSGETTMQLVELMLTPFADGPVTRSEAFVIGTDTFGVEVNPPCSGFHGIGLVTTLLAGYLWWFRRLLRFPQALLLLPIGAGLMWLANAVRIAALILVGIWISPEIAVDGFHSAAGWICFLVVGLGLIWGASRSPFFTRADMLPEEEPSAGPEAASGIAPPGVDATAAMNGPSVVACLVPFLVLTAVTMLTQAFTAGFDFLYPIRVVATAVALWCLRREIPWRTARPSLAAVAIGVGVFVLWMLLAPAAQAASSVATIRQDPLHLDEPWRTVWLLFRIAGSTITVPIAEELFFRGFVIRRCISADAEGVAVGRFTWFSFLVSSVAFGALHGDAWIAGTLAGMAFAAALYLRRQLVDAAVAHATTNAVLSGYVIATGNWSQWG